MREQQRHIISRFQAASPAQIGMVSIVVGVVTRVEDIGPLFKSFGKDLRNLVDGQRRRSDRWRDVQIVLWLEVDAFSGNDFERLGTIKAQQFGEIVPFFVYGAEPVWIVTVHGVVDADRVGLDALRNTLRHRWSAHRQVDVRAIHATKTKDKNLSNIVSYSLKNRCSIRLGVETQVWPYSWQAEYYSWLNEWSRGFHSIRLSLGRRRVEKGSDENDEEDFEPMPLVF